jgi:winged helix DNA-binding protein
MASTTTNRATLASVLRRSVHAHALGGGAASVLEAVRRAGFIYGSAPTSHLAVCVRTRGYAPGDLEEAVLRTRSLVRLRAMRGSVYLIPRELVPHALALTPLPPVEHYARLAGIPPLEVEPLTERIERILEKKALPAAGIREGLGKRAPTGDGLSAILGRMGREARIVRAGVRGGLQGHTYEYARMADWIDLPKERLSLAEALPPLARAWLLANGPASVADLAGWAGVEQRDAAAALASIGAREVAVEGIEETLLATEEVLEDLAGSPADDEEVHLVPCGDSYSMAHSDRSRYLDGARAPLVIDGMGNVTHLVLRRGRVAGIWDVDGRKLLYAAFEPLPRRALEAAAKRLAPFHAIASIEAVAAPPPLASRPKHAFLAPLAPARRP